MPMRMSKVVGVTSIIAIAFLTVGCGQSDNSSAVNTPQGMGNKGTQTTAQSDAAGNTPFQIRLKDEVTRLDPNYAPISANPSIFTNVPVVDKNGQKIDLSAKKHPILFVAYWCPHCQRTLVMLTKNESKLSQLPVIVSMGFRPNTTLAEAKKLTNAEHNALKLSNDFDVYFGISKQNVKDVPEGFPTLVYSDGQGLKMLAGEHTLAVWEKALALAK